MLDYRTPGVHIEELPATGPIVGVGTSTPAFIGPTQRGPIGVPTKITNWTQFTDTFGAYVTSPRRFLAYAVRGFYQNGGSVAYVVRVSAAARASYELDDDGANGPNPPTAGKALRIEATSEPPAGANIRVRVTHTSLVAVRAYKARAALSTAGATTIKLANAADTAKFLPGDVVTIEGQAGERAAVERIRGDELLLQTALTGTYTGGWVRIANLEPGQKSFRAATVAGIEPGTVLRIVQGATNPTVEPAVIVERVAGTFVFLEGGGLTKQFTLPGSDPDVNVTSYEFGIEISQTGAPPETYSPLSMDPRHSRYWGRVIVSQLVRVGRPGTPGVQAPPYNRPAALGTATSLAGGSPENYANITPQYYDTALAALEKTDDVNFICVPDMTDAATQGAVITHCEGMKDRVAILDSPPNLRPLAPAGTPDVLDHRASVSSQLGFAALYYPWLEITDPASVTGSETLLVPPSGHIAGIYARSDNTRGVHKAPANEPVRGTVGLERPIDDTEQGELNIEGVNVIRAFAGLAVPYVWGARTIAPRSEVPWRYISVRRLFLFIEESLQEGLRWAVFEPNDLGLWKKLERTVAEFLTRVWRAGALFGATPGDAFYVAVDEERNPPSVREQGQVVIEIGIAPVRPAEFVIVRIGMWPGGSEVTEV
jgi:phage tail sheath protein FI